MRFRPSARARARWLAAALLAAPAPLLGASPVLAGAPAPDGPVGSYVLRVTPEDGTGSTGATLTCGPDGGTHPNAKEACDQLRRVAGQVERIPENPGPCTLEYAPVRLTATGTWRGRQQRFAKTYPNRCAAIRGTGGVLFAF
ncbi:SSI family serine proteinase inhibitor [Planomonospora corallina]|uniref:SSI family serine proteinase inhibitor n=1 Tax=Planomonospora corallina TaxID=1806052 RepID=A0ABV8I7W6_9ACTN